MRRSKEYQIRTAASMANRIAMENNGVVNFKTAQEFIRQNSYCEFDVDRFAAMVVQVRETISDVWRLDGVL